MKIIQISASYKPAYIYGGPIQSVAKLCEALIANGGKQMATSKIYLQVFTTTANGITELEVTAGKPISVEGVPVTYFKRLSKDHSHFSPGLLWNLRKEILRQAKDYKRKNTDDMTGFENDKLIIHIHAWWNLVSVLSCLVAKWYNIPVVLSPRGMLTAYSQNNRNRFSKKLLHNLVGKRLLQYCHIHATSELEKQNVLSMIEPNYVTIIPNLVNLGNVQKSKHAAQEGLVFKLIFLSRLEEKKGLELLFDALSLLDIDWELIIAGSGKKEYVNNLKLKAQNLQLNQSITWIGQVSDEDKYELMANHDLLVLTSFNENFANVVVESLSVGTPVLISDQVGLSDYVLEQQFGWVSELKANAIEELLLKAFYDQEKREKIRQLAPEIIKRDFDDQTLAKGYLELYERLV